MPKRLRYVLAILVAALALAGCSAPSPEEQVQNAELAQLASLKTDFNGVVMGFDFKNDTTLLVSIDIQNWIALDDDQMANAKRQIVKRWRDAWASAHPGQHAVVTARIIDFIGRKIDEETAKV